MARFRVFVSRTQLANFEVIADTRDDAHYEAMEQLQRGLDKELFEGVESNDDIENVECIEPNYPINTEDEVRDAFWNAHPQYDDECQGDYHVDIRMAFVDFVDNLQRSGQISEDLASGVTLKE